MRNPQTRDYVKELAEEKELAQAQVWDIVKSPYLFQVHVMKEVVNREKEYVPTTRVWGSGMFYCSGYNKKKLREYLEYKRKQRENENKQEENI